MKFDCNPINDRKNKETSDLNRQMIETTLFLFCERFFLIPKSVNYNPKFCILTSILVSLAFWFLSARGPMNLILENTRENAGLVIHRSVQSITNLRINTNILELQLGHLHLPIIRHNDRLQSAMMSLTLQLSYEILTITF